MLDLLLQDLLSGMPDLDNKSVTTNKFVAQINLWVRGLLGYCRICYAGSVMPDLLCWSDNKSIMPDLLCRICYAGLITNLLSQINLWDRGVHWRGYLEGFPPK